MTPPLVSRRTGRLAAALALAALAVPARAGRLSVRVTDAKGEPVPAAVVYVTDVPGKTFAAPDEPYVMDQVDTEFEPRLLPVLVGGKVRFPNQDDIHHQIYSFSPAKSFELPLYKGEPADPLVFEKPGVVKLGCNIHDWMRGAILVLSNPYFAKTAADGTAQLDVPVKGPLELAVFHERMSQLPNETRRKVAWNADGNAAVVWTLAVRPVPKRDAYGR
jgi:plastocyanin